MTNQNEISREKGKIEDQKEQISFENLFSTNISQTNNQYNPNEKKTGDNKTKNEMENLFSPNTKNEIKKINNTKTESKEIKMTTDIYFQKSNNEPKEDLKPFVNTKDVTLKNR